MGYLSQCIAVDPQNIDVAVDKISHVQIAPVGTERDAFGEATHVGLRHLTDCLSIDLQESYVRFVVPIKGGLWRSTCAVQDQRSRIAASRAYRVSDWSSTDLVIASAAGLTREIAPRILRQEHLSPRLRGSYGRFR